MSDWNQKRDIRMTADGDLMFGGGDFAFVRNEECAAQDAYIYLRTERFSCLYWPQMGHDLVEEIGTFLTSDSAHRLEDKVVECLTRFERIPPEDLRVTVSLVSVEEASVTVDIHTPQGFVRFLPPLTYNAAGVWRA